MRSIAILLAVGLLACAAVPAYADSPERLPVILDPPDEYSMAGFTLVDWINGLAFDLDPTTRVAVQPHCNLLGGFLLGWPEADTDCNPEAVYEPSYTLDISVYHSFLLEQASAENDWGMLAADEIGGQARLNELQAEQMREAGREIAGEARVLLPGGETLGVPYYAWELEVEGGTNCSLEYAVFQPEAMSGAQVVTVSLWSPYELYPELVELATTRLRLFDPEEG